MTLNADQIARLRAARDNALADPTDTNLKAYYDVLAEANVLYGELARGVVLDNTFSGIVANNYASNKLVNDKGGSYSALEQTSLKRELMNRDFSARENAAFSDITGQLISDYHDLSFRDVFAGVSSPEEAWTAYHIVRTLDDYDAWLVGSPLDYISLATRMWTNYITGDADARGHASAWLQDMTFAQFQILNTATDDLEYGDGVLTTSFLEWWAKSGQQQHGSLQQSELTKFAQGGAAVDVPFVGAAVELAIAQHVAVSDGGAVPPALFAAAEGAQIADLAFLAEPGQEGDPVAVQLVKAGIKYDLTGDPESVRTTPNGYEDIFRLIDAFRPQKLAVEATAAATNAPRSSLGEEASAAVAGQDSEDAELFVGGSTDSVFSGGKDRDLLYGGAGTDELDGAEENDVLLGGAGEDDLYSGDGDDTLDGGAGEDFLGATGEGQTTFVFGQGYGHDTLWNSLDVPIEGPFIVSRPYVPEPPFFRSDDELLLRDLNPNDVELYVDALQDDVYRSAGENGPKGLFVKVDGSDDTFYIPEQIFPDPTDPSIFNIVKFRFGDGTNWDADEIFEEIDGYASLDDSFPEAWYGR